MPICDYFQSRGPLCMSLNCSDLSALELLRAMGVGSNTWPCHAPTCLGGHRGTWGMPLLPWSLACPGWPRELATWSCFSVRLFVHEPCIYTSRFRYARSSPLDLAFLLFSDLFISGRNPGNRPTRCNYKRPQCQLSSPAQTPARSGGRDPARPQNYRSISLAGRWREQRHA